MQRNSNHNRAFVRLPNVSDDSDSTSYSDSQITSSESDSNEYNSDDDSYSEEEPQLPHNFTQKPVSRRLSTESAQSESIAVNPIDSVPNHYKAAVAGPGNSGWSNWNPFSNLNLMSWRNKNMKVMLTSQQDVMANAVLPERPILISRGTQTETIPEKQSSVLQGIQSFCCALVALITWFCHHPIIFGNIVIVVWWIQVNG